MPDRSQPSLSIPIDGTAGIMAAPPTPPTITITGGDGNPLVKIHPTGTLEYGPGYDPDEAARRFWDAVRHYMPARCAACGHIGLPEGPQ